MHRSATLNSKLKIQNSKTEERQAGFDRPIDTMEFLIFEF
jgi:hypothetical protein